MASREEAWFERLAGREPAAADPLVEAEARLLRAAWGALPAEPEPASGLPPPDVEALVARARDAGLFTPRERSAELRWLDALEAEAQGKETVQADAARKRRRIAIASVCAGIVALVVGVQVLRVPPEPVVDVERGAAGGAVVLVAADPAALKARLLRELAEVGVPARGYVNFRNQGVDADLPSPLPGPVRAVLARYRIPVPADGVLQVEIRAPAR